MKKIIFTVLLMMGFVMGVNAQNWTQADSTEFAKATDIAFEVDLSDATIMGLSKEKYPAYYASKFGSTEKNAELLLERFCNEMEYQYFTRERQNVTCDPNAKFKIVYKITYITEKGGFGGTYTLSNGKTKSEAYPFAVRDGKWNSFDNLLLENAKKLFDHRWDKARKMAKDAFKSLKEGVNDVLNN